MAMDQYLYIPFLGGWTSIYQLFWCSPGVQGFDPSPYDSIKSLAVRGFPSLHCESAKNGAGRTALCPAKSGGSHAVTNGVGAKMISTNEYSGIETSNQFGYGGYGGYGSNLWLRFWNYVIATKTSTNFERAAGTKFWKAPVFRLHHISCFFLRGYGIFVGKPGCHCHLNISQLDLWNGWNIWTHLICWDVGIWRSWWSQANCYTPFETSLRLWRVSAKMAGDKARRWVRVCVSENGVWDELTVIFCIYSLAEICVYVYILPEIIWYNIYI